MSPTSCARLRDARARAALGLAAGIVVPAALLGVPQAAARPGPAVPASLAAQTADATDAATDTDAEAAADTDTDTEAVAGAADEQPACGDPEAKEFPIEARIQGAPKTYPSGGGYGIWSLDLTNTTATSCRALHPVLVLTDEDRRLTADQIQVKFSEPGRPGTEHRVSWETTDRHEQIGVFDGGGEDFLGFTVPARGAVSVRVRMAFTSDTVPGRVTAHAAVVQRHHQDKAKGGGREDGDWVGESGAYRFVIIDGATGEYPRPEWTGADVGGRTDVPAEPRPRTETSSTPTPAPTGTGAGTGSRTPEPVRPGDPDSSAPPRVDGGKERPPLPPPYATGRPLPELARTGPELLPWAGAAAALLVLCGAALVTKGRRMRRTEG
ncbi:peptidase [Streptomyces sp. NPDC059452]|uniref:peptidase n=1 Tax=Streptomyces sp. NPDC059452 TaxID=3346835 RepID=UPI00367A8FFE